MTRRPVVALFGPAGAGKTLVRQILATLGAATLDFDDYSRVLLVPGSPEFEQVRRELGEGYLCPDGTLDRSAVGQRVFRDPEARARLEATVHPAMLALLRRDVAAFRAQPSAPALVVEGALLGRLATPGLFDAVVLVTAPAEVRLQRLQQRGARSLESARQLVALHQELGLSAGPADFVLDTGGSPDEVREQVRQLWPRLLSS